MSTIRIAIDGPSGAGKSTLAKGLAGILGFLYVDTGAIYRTVGLHVLNKGIDPAEEEEVARSLPELQIELRYDGAGQQRMLLNGEDVSEAIRLPEVSRAASAVSALPPVRAYLLETQRELARKHNLVMDGRDIGTVVLPDAEVKIFLTASPEARAHHRPLRRFCATLRSGTGGILTGRQLRCGRRRMPFFWIRRLWTFPRARKRC